MQKIKSKPCESVSKFFPLKFSYTNERGKELLRKLFWKGGHKIELHVVSCSATVAVCW